LSWGGKEEHRERSRARGERIPYYEVDREVDEKRIRTKEQEKNQMMEKNSEIIVLGGERKEWKRLSIILGEENGI